MTLGELLTLLLAVAVAGYLVFALLRGERF